MAPAADLSPLQQRWKTLFQTTLPALARAKDPRQSKWIVQLDHCFARIILDNTVGEAKQQWDQVIGRPAVRTMSESQLQDAIELGEKIATGEVNLVELDERSLAARGKPSKAKKRRADTDSFKSDEGQFPNKKRKMKTAGDEEEGTSPRRAKKQSTLSFTPKNAEGSPMPSSRDSAATAEAELMPIYERIQAHPTLTPYRKRLYAALLTVPRGRYTTYAAMSDYLRSSPRATGNGLRNNPFAPDVPCHRVLAADGRIGGFCGDWGEDGRYAKEKVDLLKKEGVGFDCKGKVKGPIWRDFYRLKREEG